MDNIEEDKLLHLALKHFTHIMSLRSDLNLRVAKRVTFLHQQQWATAYPLLQQLTQIREHDPAVQYWLAQVQAKGVL